MTFNPIQYHMWISTDTLKETTEHTESPNSAWVMDMRYPFLSSGMRYTMTVSAFKLKTPPSDQERYQWRPGDASDGDPTSAACLTVESVDIDGVPSLICEQCITTQSWFQTNEIILGSFNANDGSDLNAANYFIKPPLAQGKLRFRIRGIEADTLLTNWGTNVEPLDQWQACLSFSVLTQPQLRTYSPYASIGGIIVNYPQSIPIPPTVTIIDRTEGTSTAGATNAWQTLEKPEAYQSYNITSVSLYMSNTGTAVNVVIDVYDTETDPSSANPNTRFAGQTVLYTTPAISVSTPDSNPVKQTFMINIDNSGGDTVYGVVREENSGSLGSTTIQGDSSLSDGGADNNFMGLNLEVTATAGFVPP